MLRAAFRNPWVQGLLLLLLNFASGRLGIHIRMLSGMSAYIWFPCGFGLAALVLGGDYLLPWIFLAAALVNWHGQGRGLPTALLMGAANAFECWLAAWLTRRYVSRRPSFGTVREVIAFASVVGVTAALGALLETVSLVATGALSPTRLSAIWRPWLLADAAGALFVGGALLTWWNGLRLRARPPFRFHWDMVFLTVALAAVSMVSYTPLATRFQSLLLRPYMLFPLMIWAAIRYEQYGATIAALLVAGISIVGASLGYTPLASVNPSEQVVLHQLFLLSWGTMGFVLAAAVREKHEAIDARNDFLSVASHELKTPVTSVSLSLQLFRRQLVSKAARTAEEERWLRAFERAGEQMGRFGKLVEQLLDISRIDRRDLLLRYESVDLKALITAYIERAMPMLTSAQCQVELALSADIHGRWDPSRIEQVLENLVSNAVKYAPGSPIRIATAVASGGSAVDIEVADRGPGISAELSARIFDRFYRGVRDTTASPGGLGLGLFISREIVQAHGGSIHVTSAPGQGARFVVRMPLEPALARS